LKLRVSIIESLVKRCDLPLRKMRILPTITIRAKRYPRALDQNIMMRTEIAPR